MCVCTAICSLRIVKKKKVHYIIKMVNRLIRIQQRIAKAIKIHHLTTMNACKKFHATASSRCWDTSINPQSDKIMMGIWGRFDLLVALDEESGEGSDQSHEELFSDRLQWRCKSCTFNTKQDNTTSCGTSRSRREQRCAISDCTSNVTCSLQYATAWERRGRGDNETRRDEQERTSSFNLRYTIKACRIMLY